MLIQTLSELMTKRVLDMRPNETLDRAASIMADAGVSSVLVADKGQPIGIITEHDILKAWRLDITPDCPVHKVMSSPVLSASCDMDWKETYHLLIQKNIRHMVVTGHHGEVVGIVSETDFRRQLGVDFLSRFKNLTAVMTSEALLMAPNDTLEMAAYTMESNRATCVVVVEDGHPLGILTERDATRLFARQVDIRCTPISSAMTSPVVTVDLNASIPEALATMIEKGLRHLVVTRNNDIVAGVISEHDIVSLLEGEYLEELRNRNDTVSAALHDSEAKLQAVFDQVSVHLGFLEPDGTVIKVNTATLKAVGCPSETVSGMPLWQMQWWSHDSDQQDYLRAAVKLAAHEGKTTRFDATHQMADGGKIAVDFTLRPILDSEGHVAYLMYEAHDITERKLAEEAVRSSQQHFEALVAATPVGVIETDPQGSCVYINQRALELTGFSREEAFGTGWIKAVHADDQQSVIRFRNDIANGNHPAQLELRFVRPDETVRWVLGQTASLRSAMGELSGKIWTVTDISQLKTLEEQLLLASSVYEACSEAILVTDAENRIVAVNPAFTRLTGYDSEEVIGHTPAILSSGTHTPEFYKSMWRALNTSGHWEGELCNKRKNGQLYMEWLSINIIRDKDGTVHRRFALFSDITEKKKTEELIWQQANYDILTGLPNRRLFRDRLQQELKKTQRSNMRLALLFIDLDRFKDVNDTLGHDFGDLLLIEAAARISECVRDSDTVARLGGDEFTIVMSNLSDLTRVESAVQAINRTLALPYLLGNNTVYLSGSIGITIFPNDAKDVETLFKNADQAMYVAKDQGRNRFSYFTETMQIAAQKRLLLSNDLRIALEEGQLEVFYQPIVELGTGRIVKAEALLRWKHPVHGFVSPVHFISIAEETGLINEIGEWVFKESARFAKRCNDLTAARTMGTNKEQTETDAENNPAGLSFQISVNKSPRQFFRGFTPESWIHYLSEIDLPTDCLSIEITEGLLLEERSEVAEKLLQFRDFGIQVSLDDFGTGYSAMSYLKKFSIDFLKIDQSFVQDMETNSNSREISEAIVAMAHKLGIKVIAEGVETAGQRNILIAAGCDYAQGYFFAKALPAEQFEAMFYKSSESCHGE